MEKTTTPSFQSRPNSMLKRMKQIIGRLEHLSAEDCLEKMTTIMYRMILFLGIPYFLYILWSFVHMSR
ncbi:MAG: hypothetical protein ABF651_00600 [Sporolactobacillus sp.]